MLGFITLRICVLLTIKAPAIGRSAVPYIENIALFTYTNSDEAPAAKLLAAFADTEKVYA